MGRALLQAGSPAGLVIDKVTIEADQLLVIAHTIALDAACDAARAANESRGRHGGNDRYGGSGAFETLMCVLATVATLAAIASFWLLSDHASSTSLHEAKAEDLALKT